MAGMQAASAVAASILMLVAAGMPDSTARARASGNGPTLRSDFQVDTASSQLRARYTCPQRREKGTGSFDATGDIVARDAAGFHRPIGTFSEQGPFTLDWTDPALPWPVLTSLRTTFSLTFSDGSGLRAEGEREGNGDSCDEMFWDEADGLGLLRIRSTGTYRVTFYDARDQTIATESGNSRLVIVDNGWAVRSDRPESDPPIADWPDLGPFIPPRARARPLDRLPLPRRVPRPAARADADAATVVSQQDRRPLEARLDSQARLTPPDALARSARLPTEWRVAYPNQAKRRR